MRKITAGSGYGLAGTSMLGGLAALAAAKLAGATVTSTVDLAAEERRKAREAKKVEERRLKDLFAPAKYRPNTYHRAGWNRVAWVYPQTREAARRLRQREARA